MASPMGQNPIYYPEIQEKTTVVKSKIIQNVITTHILRNILDESDLPILYQTYKDYAPMIQNEIIVIATRNVVQIIAEPQKVCRDIVTELIKDTSIKEINRVDLFIATIKDIRSDECKKYLKFLSRPEFAKIFEQNRRPKIPITPVNQKILIALKNAGFVDNFVEDKESKVYKQIRRRTGKTELPDDFL